VSATARAPGNERAYEVDGGAGGASCYVDDALPGFFLRRVGEVDLRENNEAAGTYSAPRPPAPSPYVRGLQKGKPILGGLPPFATAYMAECPPLHPPTDRSAAGDARVRLRGEIIPET
jgi:hypothetical protein